MLIFLQELIMQVFLWVLKAIDGVCELFTAFTGVTSVNYKGSEVNILEMLVNGSTVGRIFWCIFILAIGLSCALAIMAIVKNMIAANRNISAIVGKFFLGLLGTLAMLIVVILGILISNALLQILAKVFDIDTSKKLSEVLFDMCVGDWINDYSVAEIDFATITVRELFGDYDASKTFEIFPGAWRMNGMINPDTFLFVPSAILSFGILFSITKAVLRLAKRIYELVFMYVTMPLFISTLPLDDGARFRAWRESFVTKIALAYGAVISVNIFALLMPIIGSFEISGVSATGKAIFKIIMALGGCVTIPICQEFFARVFGSTDYEFSFGTREKRTSVKELRRILDATAYANAIDVKSGSNKYSETIKVSDEEG